jgi:hypothetical protein
MDTSMTFVFAQPVGPSPGGWVNLTFDDGPVFLFNIPLPKLPR